MKISENNAVRAHPFIKVIYNGQFPWMACGDSTDSGGTAYVYWLTITCSRHPVVTGL